MTTVNEPDTCRCPMCRHVTGHGSRGLVWSTLAATLDIERGNDDGTAVLQKVED